MQIAHFTATPEQTRQYLERLCRLLSRKDTHAACSVMNCTKNILISPPPCCCRAGHNMLVVGARKVRLLVSSQQQKKRGEKKQTFYFFLRLFCSTISFNGSIIFHSFILCILTQQEFFPESVFPQVLLPYKLIIYILTYR